MNNEVELKLERAHLEEILSVVRAQLSAAEAEGEVRHEAIVHARQELHEGTEQMFQNLHGSDDFEALLNLNQLAQPLAVKQKTREMDLVRIQSLVRMTNTPYFARIDLRFLDGGDEERVYIGRATLKDEKTQMIYVHDWRAPVSSVFYRFGVGPASYAAPAGQIDVDVLMKRQYEIAGGSLIYFFDADVAIQDEFLRQLLSKNASPRMRAIVETIQKDQDAAIRDERHELLMVEGVAGSGKTSIALHRVAYLMYDGLKSKLDGNDIVILSPNAVFERYIENVLPELGAARVRSVTFEGIVHKLAGDAQTRIERFETMCSASPADRALRSASIAFKSSEAFVEILNRFARALPRTHIPFQDVSYAGKIIATREQLKMRILRADASLPLGVRLRQMEMSLLKGARERRAARIEALTRRARRLPQHAPQIEAFVRAYSIFEFGALKRAIRRFTDLDFTALIRALYADEALIRALGAGLSLPENLQDILRLGLESPSLEDTGAAAYLRLLLMGADGTSGIRQVVVDEAQDYGALEFSILARLYKNARFTVLGDPNQVVDRAQNPLLYEEIAHALARKTTSRIALKKSFRSTREITEFSLRFLEEGAVIETFSRSGDAPEIIDLHGSDAAIRAEIARCEAQGYESIALITKTWADAEAWHAQLSLPILAGDSEARGAFIVPLPLSKGLEFDAVLVLDADSAHYAEEDANLLYVACTRALHRLNIYYQGQPSPHLLRGGNSK